MSISEKDVRWVATLARLDMTDDDVHKYTAQLNEILGYVEKLGELDTDGVEPLAHPLPVSNVFRDDEVRESLPVDVALANAPQRHGDHFGVPAVLESSGEGEA